MLPTVGVPDVLLAPLHARPAVSDDALHTLAVARRALGTGAQAPPDANQAAAALSAALR